MCDTPIARITRCVSSLRIHSMCLTGSITYTAWMHSPYFDSHHGRPQGHPGIECQTHRGVVGSRRLAKEVGVEINLISFKPQPLPMLLDSWNNMALVAPAQISCGSLRTPLHGQVLPVFPPLHKCGDILKTNIRESRSNGEVVRDPWRVWVLL